LRAIPACLLALAASACAAGTDASAGAPPAGAPRASAPAASAPAASARDAGLDARCPGPKPDPTWVCAEQCGPPVARPGYVPRYDWSDPKRVRNGKVFPCPICLPVDAQIATPLGPVAAGQVVPGMVVWTAGAGAANGANGADGQRRAGVVLEVAAARVAPGHPMFVLRLADGRAVRASGGHPTSDGRTLQSLKVGDLLDGSPIVGVEIAVYEGYNTVDLLPSGGTGTYWADGVRLGSTLREAP
jgi:hypothetical protein